MSRWRETLVPALVLFSLQSITASACGGPDSSAATASGSGAGGAGGTEGVDEVIVGAGGYAPPDPPGPRDPDAVVKAAIFRESCYFLSVYPPPEVNRRIMEIYDIVQYDPLERALDERVSCFKDKSNGCKAVEECLGVAKRMGHPCSDFACVDGVATRCSEGTGLDDLLDCEWLGLECRGESPWCYSAGEPCDSTYAANCKDGVPYECRYERVTRGLDCPAYGLQCYASTEGPYDTAGCGIPFKGNCGDVVTEGAFRVLDWHSGLSCVDSATVMTCFNRSQLPRDCTAVGEGFTCQPAKDLAQRQYAYCGLASECQPGDPRVATCEGDSLVVCNAGRIEKIDCKSLGFDSCNAEKGTCSPAIRDFDL
ncbi:hypothetical protein E8A74_38230 [Polyangium fumosum]|uniref:Dickkopf N-terminal cysteine-rich domain-containing protein n=2 Tax=Polyangium fumosum TaxID=889272 RepID=A0A4U1IYD3_9BACT|nr:hypothetical protein E8A74_38230 [Polyangium fumosum]